MLPASPRTRRQSRKSLVQDAQAALPLTSREVTSIARLGAFVELATLNPEIGTRIQMFNIDLQHETAFSVSQLRAALLLIPNVQDLFIYLPSPVPLGLLADIRLSTLVFLATNIPHASLVELLSNQRTLTSLVVGSCGRRTKTCPLAQITMPDLVALQCTTSCLDSFPYSEVSRLALDLPDSGGCMPTILRGMSQPGSTLSVATLTLDFLPDDYDILEAVMSAAPYVRKLKLVEKKKLLPPRRDSPGRRPWNNRPAWHDALCSLPLLSELAVETLSALISGRPGQEEEELRLISWWSGGSGRVDTASAASQFHPCLHHIRLRYGARTPTTRVLADWDLKDGVWIRSSSVVGLEALEME